MQTTIIIPAKTLNKVYRKSIHDSNRYQIFYGGAGSGKSVFQAQRLLIQFFEGGHNFLIVRKTGKTNRHSTFALLKQLLISWKIPISWYKINKSEMTITNTVNHSQISFAGLDDVEKLKSITFENGVLSDIWIEEASEICENDFNQLDLRLRGITEVPLTITMTFNPIDVNFWAKKRFFDNPADNCSVIKTTYLDNAFLDNEYKKVLENLKSIDPTYYSVYALGEWGVLGNLIYSNYVIHDFDYSHFEDKTLGIDFGFNMPSAVLELAIHDNEIYVCDEIYEAGLTNTDLIFKTKKKFGNYLYSIADSAEPDRIEEFKRAGFNIDPCTKGDGSIRAGIDYLKTKKIHIHKSNCLYTIQEMSKYKWREDKQGNILDMPVTFNDHAMDALRYGIEPWRLRNNEPVIVDVVKGYDFVKDSIY